MISGFSPVSNFPILDSIVAVVAGEDLEWTTLYQNFSEVAGKEGFTEASQTFAQIAKVEKEHEARYLALLKNLQSGEVFMKDRSIKWHCRNCGYVHEGKEAPEKCPVCSHLRAFFEFLAENY